MACYQNQYCFIGPMKQVEARQSLMLTIEHFLEWSFVGVIQSDSQTKTLSTLHVTDLW